MPTPAHVFQELAAQYGGIDATDADAVQRWYEEQLSQLPAETLEEVLEALLDQDQTVTGRSDPVPRNYPSGAPLPNLDEAQPVSLPLFAAGWRELIKQMLGRR
jgi:hypothetical protein